MMRGSATEYGPIVFCVLVVIAALLQNGCGGGVDAARKGLDVTASAVADTDRQLSAQQAEALDRCDAESETVREWLDCAQPYDVASTAVRTAMASLRATANAVDAWDAGQGPGQFCDAVEPMVRALADVIDAVTAVGVGSLSTLADGLRLLDGTAASYCDEVSNG